MKEQLIEMGFIDVSGDEATWFEYEFDNGTLLVRHQDGLVEFEDPNGFAETLSRSATIEQISNILKSIQI
jgi:alpha-D-ribose 1-methylphosphonate 5-triphosphate synthase subunit PhnL